VAVDVPACAGSRAGDSILTHHSTDTVFLRGLSIETTIGFFDWERHVKQTVVIDLEIPVDCARAASTDSVEDTVDYKSIAKRTIGFVSEAQFHLVETLAHKLATTLLAEFDIAWIRLSLNKPGAIRGSRDVGVTIERHRA
jgi:7,8-dihydroneopterin aldolase/epimerase/oxygenase